MDRRRLSGDEARDPEFARENGRMKRPSLTRRIVGFFEPKVGLVGIEPPKPRAERRDLAIVLIVRDAAPRIVEWVEFHLLAGVRHFYVYDDLSTDGTVDHLAPYVARGLATVLPWHVDTFDGDTGRWMSRQLLAYAHAIQSFGAGWRHMAFIDEDEFLVPTGEHDLPGTLAALGNPSNLSLPWHMFGFNAHDTTPPGGVVDNFTRRSVLRTDKATMYFKCIVDPTRTTRVGIHAFETTDLGPLSMNTLGRLLDRRDRRQLSYLTSEGIQLNHYFTRSRADLQAKIDRGGADVRSFETNRRRILWHLEAIERETVEDRRALEFLARATARG